MKRKIDISEIKTPDDVFKYMNRNIEYGWIDIQGKKHIKTMKDFRRIYRTSSVGETIRNGLGTCIEQVELMHYLLDKINVKNNMFCCRIYEPDDYDKLDEDEHMHCFILYEYNNKIYHMEHPNFEEKGIYEYENLKEAVNNIVNYYVKLRGGKESPVTEFYEVKEHLSFKEFNSYINSLEYIFF